MKNKKTKTISPSENLSDSELLQKIESLINIKTLDQEIDFEKLKKLLQVGATLEECCFYFDVTEDTLKDKVLQKFNMTFEEFRKLQKSASKLIVKTKLLEKAVEGDTKALMYLAERLLRKDLEEDTQSLEMKIVDIDNQRLLQLLSNSVEEEQNEQRTEKGLQVIVDNNSTDKDKDDL